MFNVQGSEMIFLLLIALVILGPEKLPEAVRKFTKTYAEFKKTVGGFQSEFREAMDEPMRELRETANAVRDAAKFDIDMTDGDASAMDKVTPPASDIASKTTPAVPRHAGLNFGTPTARRQERAAQTDGPALESIADDDAAAPPDADAVTTAATEHAVTTAANEDATE